jgi:hypothetical protein
MCESSIHISDLFQWRVRKKSRKYTKVWSMNPFSLWHLRSFVRINLKSNSIFFCVSLAKADNKKEVVRVSSSRKSSNGSYNESKEFSTVRQDKVRYITLTGSTNKWHTEVVRQTCCNRLSVNPDIKGQCTHSISTTKIPWKEVFVEGGTQHFSSQLEFMLCNLLRF